MSICNTFLYGTTFDMPVHEVDRQSRGSCSGIRKYSITRRDVHTYVISNTTAMHPDHGVQYSQEDAKSIAD
jgi:hypothetical protein